MKKISLKASTLQKKSAKRTARSRIIKSREKILFYSQQLKEKVINMTDTCFVLLIATAALCYALGAAIGWHIKKSTIPGNKTPGRSQARRKVSAVKKAGLR